VTLRAGDGGKPDLAPLPECGVATVEITEVRVHLRDEGDRKLKAYATITFDNAFVVRDIKVIQGRKGLFVAMPSRRLRLSCPHCGHSNVARSRYCNDCGKPLGSSSMPPAEVLAEGGEHRDVAHPITPSARGYIEGVILDEYHRQVQSGNPAHTSSHV